MVDQKTSDYTAITTADDTYLLDVANPSVANYKLTIANFKAQLESELTFSYTKSDVGLGNVDNTSDANKPVSTATQTALDLKLNTSSVVNNLTSTSTTTPLSAAQGKALKDLVDAINTLLTSDETTLDTLQEVVDFIELNRADLDSLTIASIAGLQAALDAKYAASNPSGFETPAELNARDTANRTRSNHTGTQLASTISDFAATVRSTVLTGLSLATGTAIVAGDSVLAALGKLQKQVTDLISGTGLPCEIQISCSDLETDLETGTSVTYYRMPYAMTVTEVRSSVLTAPTGSTLVVDINEGGSSILSTKLSIDASEKTSTSAATSAVISDSTLADDAEITIDIDQIGSTIAGKGLIVTLIGTRA